MSVERRAQQADRQTDERTHLLQVRAHELGEGHVARGGILHVGGDGRRAVGGPHGARHEARARGVAGGHLVACLACQARGGHVQLVDDRLQAVVCGEGRARRGGQRKGQRGGEQASRRRQRGRGPQEGGGAA